MMNAWWPNLPFHSTCRLGVLCRLADAAVVGRFRADGLVCAICIAVVVELDGMEVDVMLPIVLIVPRLCSICTRRTAV